MADVFSRYPVSTPVEADFEGEREVENYAGKFTINKVTVQDVVQEKDAIPTRPGGAIAADLFLYMGREYLMITGKYSGWPELFDFGK